MRVLVTAGPTVEYIDDVRFISNASSGKMGYAIARQAKRRGHKTVLISGPASLSPPRGVKLIRITSAGELLRRALAEFKKCDCLIMAAAVCDYAPSGRVRGKIKKNSAFFNLKLQLTPDVLGELSRVKQDRQTVVGFALETAFSPSYARKKLWGKRLDMVVLNTTRAIGADRSRAWLFFPLKRAIKLPVLSKERLASLILANAEEISYNKKTGEGSVL